MPSSSPPLSELTGRQIQWILAGAAMTFSTMPGQTVFIAMFNTSLRETFGLSHGDFGGLYTIATLASASVLVFAGALADRIGARKLGLISLAALGLMAILMASAQNVAMLVIAMAGLRFFGQGMLSHVSTTSMARWFNRFRGRALSFASLGMTFAQAIVPLLTTLAILAYGWRSVWLGTALVLFVIMAPLIYFLLRDSPDGKKSVAAGRVNPDGAPGGELTGKNWTRGKVLRDPLFYLLLPGTMGTSAIGTLFIFHQAHLVEIKGWDLTVFTAYFPVLSTAIVVGSVLTGFLVDRFGATRLLSVSLLPQGLACLVLAMVGPEWSIPIFMGLIGLTFGMNSPIVGALWAELYGTAHVGAIRALVSAALVAASAIGPGIAGYLIDFGVDLEAQSYLYAAYSFAGALLYLALRPIFRRRERAAHEGVIVEQTTL